VGRRDRTRTTRFDPECHRGCDDLGGGLCAVLGHLPADRPAGAHHDRAQPPHHARYIHPQPAG
jgi:hypothetical protein